jgi:N6-adenosine-specific RNA methylase IME4/ParB-like chromosome segregation protein Spo0J
MQLKINETYKNLIPKLDDAEFKQLEENILQHGLIDPIKVTSDYTIIDGYNRFTISQKHGIEPKVEVMNNLIDENQIMLWIINNQLGRRNITDFVKIELIQQKKLLLEKIGAENSKRYAGRPSIQEKNLSKIDSNFMPHSTRSIIAEELNWSEGKVAMAQKVLITADDDTKKLLRNGDLSISQAYKEIRRSEKRKAFAADIARQKEEVKNLPYNINQFYDVIVMDIPWDYGTKFDPETRRGVAPYPCMSLEEIAQIKIPAKDDSIIWLWTTQRFLYPAFNLLKQWNYEYKATLVWNKEKLGLGSIFRYQCEFCLLGFRGHPIWNNTTYRDYIAEAGREHSRKPEAFYKMVDDICVGAKIDYFSRTQREGWFSYGNSTTKFNINN